jgi:heat shock protein HslJ
MNDVSFDGDWVIVVYRSGDELVTPIDEGPELTLAIDGSDISGTMGLNRLVGRFEDGLIAGPLGTTRMAGPPDLMEQEDTLLALLTAADEILVDGEGMTLRRDGLNLVELRLSGTNEADGSS